MIAWLELWLWGAMRALDVIARGLGRIGIGAE